MEVQRQEQEFNMDYRYPILSGLDIDVADLRIARAVNVALAIENHVCFFFETLTCRRGNNGSEILIVKVDIEIPQYPYNGIQVVEDIAIICNDGVDSFPQVFALREDFQLGLPHTNISDFEHPVSLCLTEQSFSEIKHRFNEFEFIDSIHRWLSLTSENKLHRDDQPLEPFFNPKGFVLLPSLYTPEKYSHLNRISDSLLYQLDSKPSGKNPFRLLYIPSDAQVHGFIRKQPKNLADLGDVIKVGSVPFPVYLKDQLNLNLKKFIGNQQANSFKLAFHSAIPVKRHASDETPSLFQYLFFITDVSIFEIGERSGCLTMENGHLVPIIGKSITQEVVNEISIDLHSSMFDFCPSMAATYNNIPYNDDKFVLIGAGALGSLVFEQFMRMGFGEWLVIDNDRLYPHNLAKHALDRPALGLNKAIEVSNWANDLHQVEVATPIPDRFENIANSVDFKKKLGTSKVIIDASTSIAVARALARDYGNEIPTPRISIFLNPSGTDLVIISEDSKRKFRLDFLEIQYYRSLFREGLLHDHLLLEDELKIRYNRNSCREITNKINISDLTQNASICARSLRAIIESGNSTISIWRINQETFETQRFVFEPSRWKRMDSGGWKVYIDIWLINKMSAYRALKLPNETGGILIGAIDFQRKVIYVSDSLFAPPDSKETKDSFERGVKGLCEEYEKYLKVTDHQFCYLGEWHSHPNGFPAKPSSYDNELFDYLHKKMSKQGYPVIMAIIAEKECCIILK